MKLRAIWIGLAQAWVGLAQAMADAQPAQTPKPEVRTLESYGQSDRACREWTDGCAVCRRQKDDAPGCSLPGIACQPTAVACKGALPDSEPQKADALPAPPAPYTAPNPVDAPDKAPD